MDKFGFNDMSDEEFRRMFTKILNDRQKEIERFLRAFYGDGSRDGFSGQSRSDRFFGDLDHNRMRMDHEDFFTIFPGFFDTSMDDMNIEKGDDELGPWENKSWTSPDGSTSYNSFKRYFNGSDYNNRNKQSDIDTVKLLEMKLNKAITEEKYEDAAKIRDLINSLKEDKK